MKLSVKTKKIILIYIVILLLLFAIVEILPKFTNIFETTEVLKVGNLALSTETTGYLVKDEYVCIAKETGKVKFTEEVGTVVKKGHTMCKVNTSDSDDSTDESSKNRFSKYTERLSGSSAVTDSYKSPISGVYSLSVDGYEGIFTPKQMTKLDKATVEGYDYDKSGLERDMVYKGEPIYKVSGDDIWYVLCWMDKSSSKHYPEGEKVTLNLPDGDVSARVYYAKDDGDYVRVIFELDVYYEKFTESRNVQMKVTARADEGLIVDNSCIIEKDGKPGVYVVDKNERAKFTQIKIISTDGSKSVLKDTSFYDEEGNQITTVDVYDKVLKHPESALKKDLKKGDE